MIRAAPYGAPGLTALYRRHFLPKFLGGLGKWHLLGGNLDHIAGSGVTFWSSSAAPGPKAPQASQLDFVSGPQGVDNELEENVDGSFGLPLGKASIRAVSHHHLVMDGIACFSQRSP